MASHAEWARNAEDLIHNRGFAAQQLDLGQVSHQTGLSKETIKDSLTRREITNPDNPRGALCRPKYRIESTPLWAPSQVQEYHARKNRVNERVALARAARENGTADDSLPLVTIAEAHQRGLVTNREIVERLKVHDQTIRKHQRDDRDYPPAVGKLSREGTPGVPEHLREWRAVLEWALSKGIQVKWVA